jgi:hypothetical protein
VWTIPPNLPSNQYEQVQLVLATPHGSFAWYTSGHCAAGTCRYTVSVAEPPGRYEVRADFLWDGNDEFQGYDTAWVTVSG